MPSHGMQIAELNHRLKEVAVDLDQRIRQELAFPAVVHFYSWLLQGDLLYQCHVPGAPVQSRETFAGPRTTMFGLPQLVFTSDTHIEQHWMQGTRRMASFSIIAW